MFNIFRTTQIWWPQISILEIYFLGPILLGKGLYVSIRAFRALLDLISGKFCCWVLRILSLPALCDLILPKKKLKDERRKKKIRTIKVETEDCEALAPSDSLAPPANIMNSLPDTPSTPLPNIKEEWVSFCTCANSWILCVTNVISGMVAGLWRRLRLAPP